MVKLQLRKYHVMVSVIIPVYNAERYIKSCLDSLAAQTYPFERMEVILADDGSSDASAAICRKYAEDFANIIFLHQKNKGVSAARNLGLSHASGKYIFFLDADDGLTPNTVEDCVKFFDSVQNKVDLITYPIETYYHGKKLKPHFRYEYLKKSGIYDLRKNAFIGQTTMNIVVKNKFSENVLFDEGQTYSEDQSYCCEVLKAKLKMGFCRTAGYIYYRSAESSSGRLAGACYIFEQSLAFFEGLFAPYENVPLAFQGLFVNDIYWKMQSNIFFPYHYPEEQYEKSMCRVRSLLQKCYNSVILDHPSIDFFEKFFLLRLKGKGNIVPFIGRGEIALYSEGHLALQEKSLEIVIVKVKAEGTAIKILGFLKSAFFQFYEKAPQFYAIENGQRERELLLSPSTCNYYLSHEPTQRFWRMEYICSAKEVGKAEFYAVIGGQKFTVHYYFMPLTPFCNNYGKMALRGISQGGRTYGCSCDESGGIHGSRSYKTGSVEIIVHQDNVWNFFLGAQKKETDRVWLYYDCKGVAMDNGLRQFLHDSQKRDGITRYYVVSDERQEQYIFDYGRKVAFGSSKHKRLMVKAEKIITAYIENNNIFPFEPWEYELYANRFRFETIYLQHGVLHINMPWKYSPEKIIADKIVVSVRHETELLMKNGYKETDLWNVMMPRFDELPGKSRGEKRILYAPSWRSYLVGENKNNKWDLLTEKYLASNFFRGMQAFVCSGELQELLEEYGYGMDIKLHPIFAEYGGLLETGGGDIRLIQEVQEEEYSLFVTDFSSYLFDFLFMGTPVVSFIPDFEEFRCGMNGYRDVDFLHKVSAAQVAKKPEEAVDKIKGFLETGKGMDYTADFYRNQGKRSSKELIYERLMSGSRP